MRIGEQESWLEKVAMLIFKEVTDLLEVLIHLTTRTDVRTDVWSEA